MGFLVAGIRFVMKWGMVDARSFAKRLEAVRKSARLGLAIQGLRRGIFPIQCSLRFIYIYEKLMVAPGCILDVAVLVHTNGANAGFPIALLEVENGMSSGFWSRMSSRIRSSK